jgi:hypothetical protein
MNSTHRIASAAAIWALAATAVGQNITVGTGSSVSASYGEAFQTAGPFPWSDLGINATATVAPGDLNVATGGSTSFTLANPLSAGEQVSTGTVLNVNYTPGWTGSVAQGSVTGNVNSSFVYNIGPISGSSNLINVPVSSASSPTQDLAASLNAGAGSSASTSVSGSGPSATAGFSLEARACAFVCVTLASANLGVTVGTQVQQSVTVSPTVTYGDLVWISTTPTSHYSAGDPQAFIAGSGGTIANPLGNFSGLGLTTGQTFYYNMMPEVKLGQHHRELQRLRRRRLSILPARKPVHAGHRRRELRCGHDVSRERLLQRKDGVRAGTHWPRRSVELCGRGRGLHRAIGAAQRRHSTFRHRTLRRHAHRVFAESPGRARHHDGVRNATRRAADTWGSGIRRALCPGRHAVRRLLHQPSYRQRRPHVGAGD